jgi:hypothetical protein
MRWIRFIIAGLPPRKVSQRCPLACEKGSNTGYLLPRIPVRI